MTQHRVDSIMEAVCNCAVGIVISVTANQIFIPMVTGRPLAPAENAGLAIIYTIISLTRQYALRRMFNGRTIWAALRGSAG